MKKALFLDRDGVINELVYYPESGIVDTPINPSQVKLVFGIEQLIHQAKKLGYLVIVISNQSSIGLSKIKMWQFGLVDKKIRELLKKNEATVDMIYYCFHHPFAKILKYRVECNCRKPKIGLYLKAAKQFNIDTKQSWMLGDGVDDIKSGKEAGCKNILLANINSAENLRIIEQQLGQIKPNYLVKKIADALNIIR